MGFLEDARRLPTGPRCTVGTMLRSLDDALRADVETAMALAADPDEPRYGFTSVSRALKDRGFPISDTTLRRHKRGDCDCA